MENIDNVEVEKLQNAKFVKPFRMNYSQNGIRKTWEVVSVHSSVIIIIYNTDRKKLIFVKQFRPAVYFSNFPQAERELVSCKGLEKFSSKSTATQSVADQCTQQTQTLQHNSMTQHTQTTAQQTSHPGIPTAVQTSSQSTQSSGLEQASQATQSEVAELRHQASQSDVSQISCRSSRSDGSCLTRKTMPTLPASCGICIELCAGIVDKDAPLVDIAREEVLEECGYNVSVDALEQIIEFRSGVGITGDLQTLFYVEVTDAMKVSEGGGLVSEGELIDVVEMSVEEVRALLQQPTVQAPAFFLYALMWFLTNKAHQ